MSSKLWLYCLLLHNLYSLHLGLRQSESISIWWRFSNLFIIFLVFALIIQWIKSQYIKISSNKSSTYIITLNIYWDNRLSRAPPISPITTFLSSLFHGDCQCCNILKSRFWLLILVFIWGLVCFEGMGHRWCPDLVFFCSFKPFIIQLPSAFQQ